MLQEPTSTTWDFRSIIVEPSASLKIYFLFLVVIGIATSIKLVRVWRAAPPFRTSRQHNSAYLPLLQSSAASLKQWITFTYLGWGIFASTSVFRVCDRLLDDKRVGSLLVVFLIREFSTTLTMALLAALFAFLAQWHVSKRIDSLRKS